MLSFRSESVASAFQMVRRRLSKMILVAVVAYWTTPLGGQEAQYVEVDGVRLEYLDWGDHGRPILLIPPGCDTAHVYGDIGPLLAGKRRTISFTQRGCGSSGRPDAGYHIDDLVEEIAAFMSTLGIERAVLAGASSGGGKITRFAQRYPHRVEKLVYFDTIYSHIVPGIEEGFGKAIAERVGGWPNESFDLMRTSEQLWELGAWSAARDVNLHETYIAASDGSLKGVSSAAWLRAFRQDNQHGLYFSTKIDHPALMLFAKDLDRHRVMQFDQQTQQELEPIVNEMIEGRNRQIEDFRRNGSHVRIVELDRTGHYLFVHRPNETVRLIEEFLLP